MKLIDNNYKIKSIPEWVVHVDRLVSTDNVIVSRRKSKDYYYLEQDGSNTYTLSTVDYGHQFWNPMIDYPIEIKESPDEDIVPIKMSATMSPIIDELEYFSIPDEWQPSIEPFFIIKPQLDGNIPPTKVPSANTEINTYPVDFIENLIVIDRIKDNDRVIIDKSDGTEYILNEDRTLK